MKFQDVIQLRRERSGTVRAVYRWIAEIDGVEIARDDNRQEAERKAVDVVRKMVGGGGKTDCFFAPDGSAFIVSGHLDVWRYEIRNPGRTRNSPFICSGFPTFEAARVAAREHARTYT